MKFTKKELETIKYYDENFETWFKNNGEDRAKIKEPFFSEYFKKFIKLSNKGNIIEFGCGAGIDAKFLIKEFGIENYLGTDVSEGFLKISRLNNPKGNFRNISFYDLDKLKNKFDNFWASSVLIHIPKDRIQKILNSINKVLNIHAVGMISLIEGEGDMQNSRKGRYYSLYKLSEFKKLLINSGFVVHLSEKFLKGKTNWLVFIVQKK